MPAPERIISSHYDYGKVFQFFDQKEGKELYGNRFAILHGILPVPDENATSADGSVMSLGRRVTSSYAEITLVHKSLFSGGREITWKYGKLVPEDGSIISTHGILASMYGDMNKKPIFIVPAYAEVRFPYKRTTSLPGIWLKSYAAKTSTYSKTKRNCAKLS